MTITLTREEAQQILDNGKCPNCSWDMWHGGCLMCGHKNETMPMTFDEWLAAQHGDPLEIGFLQALRIAYNAGQDSVVRALKDKS